ncbi:hypothetical protein EN962_27005 [Mesorhizobium sp. M7A.F.Ca.CA.001.09.2.1]|nr:hypothetical protein EN981_25730 [Mesorhizobium sp. M7A.F.Ca.CA.001.13.2.1]RUY59800.1 hypothetical protein EN965_31800 [Mesorhizobium sp. M7A.F.Ca.CA.001.05.1.1]RUY65150.1 hypothetical protein EN980_23540 [Mesorhizobium sp. M7A.F.Ca.CA.001.13.1.1]RUY73978.1 hypothetical protein EN962_27005 [Mesorhizobium sp. M7A.F.Ca.CA.001.09.2.1]RUZ06462.1 hypothetical protein EN955_15445 [Mesorhizobium sp. M7A.F.Ca.CA.001.04.2.1]RUZ20834.1 hypothetical protein EN961_15065 [Mesorhizobium sp. M7A.F.Ca.CA.0
MLALEHPPLACRPSPPQGGRSAAWASRSCLQSGRLAKAVERAISPLAGEMSGRTEGSVTELDLSSETAP